MVFPKGTFIGLHGSTLRTGPVAVNRTYYQWDDDSKEDKQIKRDHDLDILPWVSFKPPGSLIEILAGQHDQAILAKGERYRSYGKPVITTFFHEPVGDVNATEWERAYFRIRNKIVRNGGFGNTVYAPILNGYLWNNWYSGSKGAVEDWVTDRLITRSRIFGVDHYATADEMQRMFDYLISRGVRGIGIAEFGRDEGPVEFRKKLDLFRQYPKIDVVCYFNSRIQVFGAQTELGPGLEELEMFKDYLATSSHL
jgi:hypothetical protein